MLTVFLRRAQPGVIFFILLLSVLLWLTGWVHNGAAEIRETTTGPLTGWIYTQEWIDGWFSRLIMLVLLLLLGFFAVSLNTRFNFIHERSFLPAIFFMTIAGALPETQYLNASVIGVFFLMLALEQIFSTYRFNGISFHYFRAGLFLGLGFLFYPPMVVFIAIIYVGLSYLRTFNWREWLTPVIGFLLPLYFYAGIYYLIKGEWEPLKEVFVSGLTRQISWGAFTLTQIVFFTFLGILILISSFHMISRFTSKKVSSRIYLQVIFWSFIITLATFFLIPSTSIEILVFSALPLSYLFTTYFTFHRPVWWCEMMLWLFILTLGFLQLYPFLT